MGNPGSPGDPGKDGRKVCYLARFIMFMSELITYSSYQIRQGFFHMIIHLLDNGH